MGAAREPHADPLEKIFNLDVTALNRAALPAIIIGSLIMTRTEPSETINHRRRSLIGVAAMTLAAFELGADKQANAASSEAAKAMPASPKSFGPLRQIDAGQLNVGYAELGPADGGLSFCFTDGHTTSTPMSTSLHC